MKHPEQDTSLDRAINPISDGCPPKKIYLSIDIQYRQDPIPFASGDEQIPVVINHDPLDLLGDGI